MQMLTHASIGDKRQCVLGDYMSAFFKLLQEDLATVQHNGLHLVHRLGLQLRRSQCDEADEQLASRTHRGDGLSAILEDSHSRLNGVDKLLDRCD